MSELSKITQTLMEGDGGMLVTLVSEALEQGRTASEILNDELIADAPVYQEFADKIGADADAPDPGPASRMAKSMVA